LTAKDLITTALELIGAVSAGNLPDPEDLNAGMRHLNIMLAEWDMNELMANSQIGVTASLTPGKFAYSIGTGKNFNTSQPDLISGAILTDTASNIKWPMLIVGLDIWSTYNDQPVSSGLPAVVYYDKGGTQQSNPQSRGTGAMVTTTAPEGVVTGLAISAAGGSYLVGDVLYVVGGNYDCTFSVSTINGTGGITGLSLLTGGTGYPNSTVISVSPQPTTYRSGTLNLYPTPDAARPYTLTVYMTGPFQGYVNLAQESGLPDGYSSAVVQNLALRLCPVFERPVPPAVEMLARRTMADIYARNIRMVPASMDALIRTPGRSDFYSGNT
jgi:hypothetical protein